MGQKLMLPVLMRVLMLNDNEVCNTKLALSAAAEAAAASAAVRAHIDDSGCANFLLELCDVFCMPRLRATDQIWNDFVVA